MTEDVNGNIKMAEGNLLLVSGSKGSKGSDKDYVKKLSNAILQVFSKYETTKMRCVGAASLNNAIKAYIIAKGEAKKNGDNLLLDANFTTVQFEDKDGAVEEKTGVVLEIISVDD